MSDIAIAVDAFVGVMVAEVVVKPIAVRLGRLLLKKADGILPAIPDWLHSGDSDSV